MLWATWRAYAKESGATTENLHKNQFLSSACVAGTEGLIKNHHLKAPFPLLHYSPFFPLITSSSSLTITRSVSPVSFLIYKMISFLLRSQWENNITCGPNLLSLKPASFLTFPYLILVSLNQKKTNSQAGDITVGTWDSFPLPAIHP